MLVRTRLAHLLVAATVTAPLLTVVVAGSAAAHGAPTNPVSRSFECGPEGSAGQTAACRAARAGAGGAWFDQWDYVRVADVDGRDRETIPDGQLCSGGIDNFGGLDLARADWPTTQLHAGAAITVRYRSTLPHEGTFRMYVTKDSYDPTKPLRWADVETKPFLTATDPSFDGTAYAFHGTLPRGKTGRQIIYTIWQNSSTSDTYYSCSDVVFTTSNSAAGSAAATSSSAKAATSGPAATSERAGTETSDPTASAAAGGDQANDVSTGVSGSVVAAAGDDGSSGGTGGTGGSLPGPMLAGGGLLAVAGSGAAVVFFRRGRRRHKVSVTFDSPRGASGSEPR